MGKSLQTPVDIVRERSGGCCERCGVVLTRNVNGVPDGLTARTIHHRQPRRLGGRDSVINLVNLCIGCHREIHDDEENARLDGWIILDRRFPGKVPFAGHRGWVLPQPDGGLVELDWTTGRTRPLAEVPRTTRARRVATRSRPGHRKSRKSAQVA